MHFLIEIVKGQGAGQIYPLTAGVRIGRGPNNNIQLMDKEVSTNHATVQRQGETLYLMDLGSNNGSKIRGTKFERIPLQEGLIVQLGETWLRIASQEYRLRVPFIPSMLNENNATEAFSESALSEIEKSLLESELTLVELSSPIKSDGQQQDLDASQATQRATLPAINKPQIDNKMGFEGSYNDYKSENQSEPTGYPVNLEQALLQKDEPSIQLDVPYAPPSSYRMISTIEKFANWHRDLARALVRGSKDLKDSPKIMSPLTPTVELLFKSGRQADTHWTLGYGPRTIGSRSFELEIHEPGAPDQCFEISQGPNGPTFHTLHPDIVRLNGIARTHSDLSDGDTISIGATKIVIRMAS